MAPARRSKIDQTSRLEVSSRVAEIPGPQTELVRLKARRVTAAEGWDA